VLGYNYTYLEHTDKVNYARAVYDSTLDRSYEYDQVGALVFAHSGAEARAAFGIDGQQWGTSDGPYSHRYDYDKQGNMTRRNGGRVLCIVPTRYVAQLTASPNAQSEILADNGRFCLVALTVK
jgi:hypothetical protein